MFVMLTHKQLGFIWLLIYDVVTYDDNTVMMTTNHRSTETKVAVASAVGFWNYD